MGREISPPDALENFFEKMRKKGLQMSGIVI